MEPIHSSEPSVADTAGTSDAPLQWLSEHHAPTATPLVPAATAGTATLEKPSGWLYDFFTGNPGGTANGPIVNEHTALNYAALYSCVSLIAGTVASLPLKVYRRRSDGGQDEAPERPEYDRLQVEFNPNTSAMSGRETGLGHLLTWGNSYTQIVRNRLPSRDVIRLQPLGPDIVCPDTNDKDELEYEVYDRQTGQVIETLRRDEVLHVPGFSFDAMCGNSVVRMAKSILRAGMAQDKEAERFVTRGIRPPGAIRMQPGKKFADEKQAIKFRDTFRKIHSTEEGSLNIVILEDGMEWIALGVDPVSAQLLESRKFSAQEIASIYHVPPHMMGMVDKVTSWGTGIEEQTIGFVVYTLLPILRRIEQEYNRKLFRGDASLYCEHVLSGLLRGDHLKRSQALQIMMDRGIITVNEWRRLEGMNPVKGGNIRYYPLNMGRTDEDGNDIPPAVAAGAAGDAGAAGGAKPPGTVPSPGQAPPKAIAPSLAHDPTKLADSLRAAIVGAAGRCLRKEAAEAVKAAKKPESFCQWVDAFYAKHAEMVNDACRPLMEAWGAAFPTVMTDGTDWPALSVKAHVDRSQRDLLTAAECKADELGGAVEKVTQRWTSDRLAEIGASLQPAPALTT